MTIPTFPTFLGLTWPVKRTGPIFDTVIQDSYSGKQTAYSKRVTPKWMWELPFEFLYSSATKLEMQTLAGFYASVRGRARVFQYRDVFDNIAAGESFGVGDGLSRTYQLTRAMGGFVEPVFAPDGPLTINVSGSPTVAYVLDPYGMINFDSAPAAGAPLSWSGSYNWLCRFEEDKIEFSNFMKDLWSADKVSFTSVIP